MATGLLVADTDLLVDFLRRKDPGRSRVREWLTSDRLRVGAVTAFELRLGADFLFRRTGIEAILRRRTLPLDFEAALIAGEVYMCLERQDRGVGLRDSLLAGICLRFGLPLATRNKRLFERVEGLRLASV